MEAAKKYKCKKCGYTYDPEIGDPKHGIDPGTPFEELPEDWKCPRCRKPKDQFVEKEEKKVLLFLLSDASGSLPGNKESSRLCAGHMETAFFVTMTGGLLLMKEKIQATGKYDCIRLENQLCFPLYACAKALVRQYRRPLEELGLTYTQYLVMMVLWEHGGMTESELGSFVHLDSGTLTPLLKRLEKQRLINRIRPDTNERKLFLSLTEEGEALKDRALTIPAAMHGSIDLPKEDLMQLKSLLDRALIKLEE